MKLGSKVDTLRRSLRKMEAKIANGEQQTNKSRSMVTPALVSELTELGFQWNMRTRIKGHDLLLAIKAFAQLYGHLRIPRNFVVPHQSPDWPEEFWGLKLGWRIAHIRTRGDFCHGDDDFREKLDELGFEWVTARLWKDEEFNFILSSLVAAASASPSSKKTT